MTAALGCDAEDDVVIAEPPASASAADRVTYVTATTEKSATACNCPARL